ncbi:MAG: hypothetical protein EXR95_04110 [Gemmatimonadetes bacterium]|nr:hypothetical protein [Gemmatimonadota bacterium]
MTLRHDPVETNPRFVTQLAEAQQLAATRGSLVRASARLDTVGAMLVSVLGAIERGEGNTGKLLWDDALYMHTEALLSSLDELVRDVKANPRRYINLEIF